MKNIKLGAAGLQSNSNLIVVYHANGLVTQYAQVLNTDISRGTVLMAAASAAISGDTFYLAEGTFDIQNNYIDTSIGNTGHFNIVGSGKYTTIIKSSYGDPSGILQPIIRGASNQTIEMLSIIGTLSGISNYQACYGLKDVTLSTDLINVILYDVYMQAGTDCFYFIGRQGNVSIKGLTTLSLWDSVVFSPGSSSGVTSDFLLRNSLLQSIHGVDSNSCRGIAADVNGNDYCSVHLSDVRIVSSSLSLSIGVSVGVRSIIYLDNVRFEGTGGTRHDIYQVGYQSLAYVNIDCVYDPASNLGSAITIQGNIGDIAWPLLTASKLVFTDANKHLTSTGIGTASQFIKGDGSLDSNAYITGTPWLTDCFLLNQATPQTIVNASMVGQSVQMMNGSYAIIAIGESWFQDTSNTINVDITSGGVGVDANHGSLGTEGTLIYTDGIYTYGIYGQKADGSSAGYFNDAGTTDGSSGNVVWLASGDYAIQAIGNNSFSGGTTDFSNGLTFWADLIGAVMIGFPPTISPDGKLNSQAGAPTFDWVNLKFPTLNTNGFLKTGSSDGTILVDTNAYLNSVDVNRYGFLNQTETTIAFDGAKIFTLGSTSFSYYRAGIKYTITGNKMVDLTTVDATLVDGAIYYIYINSTSGVLSASRSSWTLNDTLVPVATILWNNTLTPKYWLADERHTCLIDRRDHYIEHFTEGCKISVVGALTGYTKNSDVNANKTFQIAATTMLDEDIIHAEAYLPQPNGTNADYLVFYRTTASTWAWKTSNMPFIYNVGNTNDIIQYDNAGTMADCGTGNGANTKWVNSYLLVSNIEGAARYILIMGQAQFTSLTAAQSEAPSALTLTGFPIVEAAFMYRITWSTITSTSQGKCVLAADPQKLSLPAVSNVGSGASVDHNSLAGLQGGSSTQRYHSYQTKPCTIFGDMRGLYVVSADWIMINLIAAAYPNGITVTQVTVDCSTASPTTQLTGKLKYCDTFAGGAFPGANPTDIVTLTTTSGNYDSGAISISITSGHIIYLELTADPTDYNTTWFVTFTYIPN